MRDFLWTHSFLSVYCDSDTVMAALWGVSDVTFMSKVNPLWMFLHNNLDEVFVLLICIHV